MNLNIMELQLTEQTVQYFTILLLLIYTQHCYVKFAVSSSNLCISFSVYNKINILGMFMSRPCNL